MSDTASNKNSSKVDDKWKDVTVVREGNQIILPKGMSFDDGMEWLRRKKVEDEREVAINEIVEGFPLDGAIAFHKAISRKYGFAGLIPTPGFWGPTPPTMVGVQVSVDETVQVPWGRLQIPNIEGFLQTQVTLKDGRMVFLIGGRVKQRYKAEIAELAATTRQIVLGESIYRGKAVKVSFPEIDPENFSPTDNAPKFLDVRNVRQEELIFSKDVAVLIQDSLFTPIEHTSTCRALKIPLKRGILLEGPYGTGKTLTAYVTASKAVKNGWTFIYLETVKDLQRAIFFAQQYGPAVIFAEDIDQVVRGNRSEEMNGILNTIDGVDTKSSEIIVVLTTNHVELINAAMLRPGRLDAVIPVRPPDTLAVGKLIRLYARGLVEENASLEEAGKLLQGQIPAVIREVVERSKLSAVTRTDGNSEFRLTDNDLVHAAKSMLAQIALINPNTAPAPHPMEVLGRALGREIAIGQVVSSYGKDLDKVIPSEIISETVNQLQKRIPESLKPRT